jgi:FAD/FMN-containing dehydrogenase
VVTGGLVAHPFEHARDVLRFFRDVTASLPDEMTVFGGLLHAPDGSGAKLAAMVTCHCGPLPAGETATRPLRQFGAPAMDAIGPMPYCQLNGMLDGGFPRGALNYWKSRFLAQLSDDAVDTMIECFARCPTPMGALLLEHFHGAATRVRVGDTAFPHRADGHNLLVLAQWMDPAATERCIAWARKTYSDMEPFMAAGRYVNYLADDETGDPTAAAYGPNYRRLQEIKAKYDPGNFFHVNQNIRPS